MIKKADLSPRCGIVLAGGEGKRLKPLIHQLRGDTLPKQYVNFTGTRSMLEHTFHRVEKLIPPERLFTVVNQDHLAHSDVKKQLSSRPSGTVIVQPENKETGPGILLPLMHLYKRFPESVVVIFPSDHFIGEEDLFMAHVDLACRVVEVDPSCLVLLGMEPNGPEPEYGYILPGGEVNRLAKSGAWQVSRFVEKPEPHAAGELVLAGGLWNTMVMAFRAKTLLDMVRRAAPRLYRSFERILGAIGTLGEMDVVRGVYQDMEAVNFSRGLLELFSIECASRLLVLPVRGVFWSDWGSEQRVAAVLRKSGRADRIHGSSENRHPSY